MANPEHLAKLLEGREAWNAWRKEDDVTPDLTDANLRGLKLSGFNISNINLSRANLQGVTIRDTPLLSINAEETDWTAAELMFLKFIEVRAPRATFHKAFIGLTTFHDCNLQQASFEGTTLFKSVFANTDLRGIQGWQTAIDLSLGIDTFFRSGGLSDELMRSTEIPEEFITYARSLTGTAIEFYSCFISYTTKDSEFTKRLHADLQARNIKTWFAPENLKTGDRFHSRIDESIRIHDKLVLILSEHSIESAWVRREVEAAIEREDREKNDVLFPIRLDDTIFDSKESWANDIKRSRHIGDFRNWKLHDDYAVALDRLVRDLKKEGPIVMR